MPKEYQTTKASISEVLSGFQRTDEKDGFEIFKVKGWDYPALLNAYEEAEKVAREEHVPVLVHVYDLTQPQGHSTSGSHERYKSEERLQFEEEFCCIDKTREWMIEQGLADEQQLEQLEKEVRDYVREQQKEAWKAFKDELKEEMNRVGQLLDDLAEQSSHGDKLQKLQSEMKSAMVPLRRETFTAARKALRVVRGEDLPARKKLIEWLEENHRANEYRYDSYLYSESDESPLHVQEVEPEYPANPEEVDGRVVLRDNFDAMFDKYPEVLVFGEDTGKLGDVNKGLENMQEKYGELRVQDTGIREATILGQGIGLALRGLRPIAEIQYLDYLLFCFQTLSDDLATLRYRSMGGQKAPVIVRTRGHRLEGIWHTGSPMGMIINGIRGVHVCVPRNLTDAAGMYNTLMQGDDPALLVEPLNAYRSKEKMPSNVGEFTVPLGIPNIIAEGEDITIVSYGSTCNICESVIPQLAEVDISAELIDVRTLLPFDREKLVLESLKKTNRILFVDEDVPGGATAFMMNCVIDEDGGYYHLDSEPQCLTAKEHRAAYGSDGDYFSKPNAEDIFEAAYGIMHEANPAKYPPLFEG